MTTASIFNYFRKAPSQTIASPSKLDIGYAIYNGITKAQHISYHQMFSLYTNFPTTYHLNTNKPLKNITLTHPELIAFEKEYDELLSCKTDQSFEKIAKIFEAVHQNIDNIELHQWMVGEILAKALAIIPLEKGQLITIPVVTQDKQRKMVTFEVDQCFDMGHGIPAYGLKPQSAHGFHWNNGWPSYGSYPKDGIQAAPILLFRGTDFCVKTETAKKSIAINFDPKGAGLSLFEETKNLIGEWLKRVTTSSQKARVMGYSQGGAFAQYTVIHHNTFISNLSNEPSMIFNAPGVSKTLLKQWGEISEDQKPLLISLIPSQDPVTQFGFLIGNAFQFNPKKPMSLTNAHFPLMLFQPSYSIVTLDTEKENTSSRRHHFTKFQTELDPKITEAVKTSLDKLGKSHYGGVQNKVSKNC